MCKAWLGILAMAAVLSAATLGDPARATIASASAIGAAASDMGIVKNARVFCSWHGYFPCVLICPDYYLPYRSCVSAAYGDYQSFPQSQKANGGTSQRANWRRQRSALMSVRQHSLSTAEKPH